MDIDSLLRGHVSRRRFLQTSGAVGASAVVLSACGGDDNKTGVGNGAAEQDKADVEVLNGTLDLELMVLAAYKAGAALLKAGALQTVKGFLEQEQEHADALAKAIRDAGGTPNRAKSSYELPKLRSQRDMLMFAVRFENTAIAAYIDALPKLSKGDLRATVASILTNEAQHVAVLRGELDLAPAPDAFVTGEVR
jgi:bacterioferritin (cytochrome b1)